MMKGFLTVVNPGSTMTGVLLGKKGPVWVAAIVVMPAMEKGAVGSVVAADAEAMLRRKKIRGRVKNMAVRRKWVFWEVEQVIVGECSGGWKAMVGRCLARAFFGPGMSLCGAPGRIAKPWVSQYIGFVLA